jgi:hypothetical protein
MVAYGEVWDGCGMWMLFTNYLVCDSIRSMKLKSEIGETQRRKVK